MIIDKIFLKAAMKMHGLVHPFGMCSVLLSCHDDTLRMRYRWFSCAMEQIGIGRQEYIWSLTEEEKEARILCLLLCGIIFHEEDDVDYMS